MKTESQNFEPMSECFQGNVYPGMSDHLASDLGVTSQSLYRLGIGWVPVVEFKNGRNCQGWWAIPERDAVGQVVGLSLRANDGAKAMYPGSARGLVYPIAVEHSAGVTPYVHGSHNWKRTMDAGVICPICGKPDGCLVSSENVNDPQAVVCIRVKEGAKRELKFGFLHIRKDGGRIDSRVSPLPDSELPVLIVEGMTDTAAALDMGFVAVGRPSNLGGLSELTQLVAGRHVIIVGENDRKQDGSFPGRDGMLKAYNKLKAQCSSCRMVMPPAKFKDLRQWKCEPELTTQSFLDYVESHGVDSTSSPVVVRASSVVTQPLRWAWHNRFPLGKLSILAGPGGLGKTTAMLDIVARATTGREAPDGSALLDGSALIVSAEDDFSDTLVPRLKEAGANLDRIGFLTGIKLEGKECWLDLNQHLKEVEQAIVGMGDCTWLIIDPITAYLGRIDSHSNSEVRNVLGPLSELSAKKGVAVVGITHLTKNSNESVGNRVIGSVAFLAAARSAYAVGQDKNDSSRRLFLPVKSNLAPGDIHGLSFSVASVDGGMPRIEWSTIPVDTPADEAFAPKHSSPGPDPDERSRAEEWLKSALSHGVRLSNELMEEAKECEGLSKTTLYRAKKELRIEAFREKIPGPWLWRLPK